MENNRNPAKKSMFNFNVVEIRGTISKKAYECNEFFGQRNVFAVKSEIYAPTN